MGAQSGHGVARDSSVERLRDAARTFITALENVAIELNLNSDESSTRSLSLSLSRPLSLAALNLPHDSDSFPFSLSLSPALHSHPNLPALSFSHKRKRLHHSHTDPDIDSDSDSLAASHNRNQRSSHAHDHEEMARKIARRDEEAGKLALRDQEDGKLAGIFENAVSMDSDPPRVAPFGHPQNTSWATSAAPSLFNGQNSTPFGFAAENAIGSMNPPNPFGAAFGTGNTPSQSTYNAQFGSMYSPTPFASDNPNAPFPTSSTPSPFASYPFAASAPRPLLNPTRRLTTSASAAQVLSESASMDQRGGHVQSGAGFRNDGQRHDRGGNWGRNTFPNTSTFPPPISNNLSLLLSLTAGPPSPFNSLEYDDFKKLVEAVVVEWWGSGSLNRGHVASPQLGQGDKWREEVVEAAEGCVRVTEDLLLCPNLRIPTPDARTLVPYVNLVRNKRHLWVDHVRTGGREWARRGFPVDQTVLDTARRWLGVVVGEAVREWAGRIEAAGARGAEVIQMAQAGVALAGEACEVGGIGTAGEEMVEGAMSLTATLVLAHFDAATSSPAGGGGLAARSTRVVLTPMAQSDTDMAVDSPSPSSSPSHHHTQTGDSSGAGGAGTGAGTAPRVSEVKTVSLADAVGRAVSGLRKVVDARDGRGDDTRAGVAHQHFAAYGGGPRESLRLVRASDRLSRAVVEIGLHLAEQAGAAAAGAVKGGRGGASAGKRMLRAAVGVAKKVVEVVGGAEEERRVVKLEGCVGEAE
ncbi:hypothetical protein M427DRAFT_150130 [Gonapodya prolifera JEL478]|uniref:Uncharacterized protein n=1 Tax=Gonapodya prolifera (strain JEL478) TaxID=1344416 RepID=A0A138ZXG8_GONPJ|nr:hypothetical protein M427DRAFT_150130 [Gonapodya prolifera JEL478]|eukprot:KXS09190.1 hypothetical protein M427DRAFT_150130 [Gonapodya prolifera JEL478]